MPAGSYTYAYPRPMVTVDAVVFMVRAGKIHVLLIERGQPPFAGEWALPGGFVQMDETLDAAVRRELEEETGLSGISLRQFYTFGDPGRDPRGRSVSIAYWGIAPVAQEMVRGQDDAADARWFPMDALPKLAFDHGAIVASAWRTLQLANAAPDNLDDALSPAEAAAFTAAMNAMASATTGR